MGLCSLPEYLQMQRYLAHWLRDPSTSFQTQVALSRDHEVFALHPLKDILLETVLP
jgi:hypothetical protein